MKWNTLIVEDDRILQVLIKKMLCSIEWKSPLLSFENGLLALNYLKDSYRDDCNFIVFLDINMPVMNGSEFLDRIKGLITKDNVYVYVLSSSIDTNDHKKALANRFVMEYIPKPISISQLQSIKEFVNDRIEAE